MPGEPAPRSKRRAKAPVAQRIEQQPSNLTVVGSSPTGGADHVLTRCFEKVHLGFGALLPT
jgi:hypothetical protein